MTNTFSDTYPSAASIEAENARRLAELTIRRPLTPGRLGRLAVGDELDFAYQGKVGRVRVTSTAGEIMAEGIDKQGRVNCFLARLEAVNLIWIDRQNCAMFGRP